MTQQFGQQPSFNSAMIEETVVSIGNPFDDPPAPTRSGPVGNSSHPPQMMMQFGSSQHYTSFPPSSSSYHAMMYQQQLSNNAPLIHLCAECNREIKDDEKGIQCEAASQGCYSFYHQECSRLTIEAYDMLMHEKHANADWVCNNCANTKQIEYKRQR